MTDKQFPPTQIARSVPLAEAEIMRKWMSECRRPWLNGSPLLRLVEFVEQWKPKAAANMAVEHIGTINEVRIIDDGIDEEQINLVRLNRRVFVPEEIEAEGDNLVTVEIDIPIRNFDEDELTELIDNTLGPDWTSRDAARAILAELYGKGEE